MLVSNATTQWATLMLSGPLSRQVLQTLDCSIDLGREAFAHMRYREGTLCGVSCRILRASYSGEISWEISVPARYGQSLWDALMEAGRDFGITPFGVESLMVLRTEKGYLHIGTDTDGNTMPQDLGWGAAIARKSADFVGRRSLSLEAGKDLRRLQFTGIELFEPDASVPAGAHVLAEDGCTSAGYVTSACLSPTLGRSVALGLVAGAQRREGQRVQVFCQGRVQPARLVKACAYDPPGERLDG